MKLVNNLLVASLLLGLVSCNTTGKKNNQTVEKKDSIATYTLTPATLKLKELLTTVHQHGFMFGHQDDLVYGVGWAADANRSDVKSVCGDYPAIAGFEVGGLELGDSVSLDKVSFALIRQRMVDQYKRGGMSTLSWHLHNPFNGGTAWDVTSKDSVVVSILDGGKNHAKFLGWLDTMAQFLNSIKTDDGVKVPILFRPWHEHTGSWFWWGKDHCTPDQYKQLWIMTHNYLKSKGVDNVLYAYSPGGGISGTEYMERYPGDQYVDLLGFDYYQLGLKANTDYIKAVNTSLIVLTDLGKTHNKPIAITETGFSGTPDAQWWTKTLYPTVSKYPIAYVLVWRNDIRDLKERYAPYPKQVSAKDFVLFYKNPKTLFCKDLTGLSN